MCTAAAQQAVHTAGYTLASKTLFECAAEILRINPRLCCRQTTQYVRGAMREGAAKAMQAGTHLAFCRLDPMAACSSIPCCPGMRG